MYTLVMMAALTTNANAPAWGCRGCCHGCWGCFGCWGGCRGCHGCWGGCRGCAGCYGCTGCSGCYASWGACYGGCAGCYGGYGGCYGCYGGYAGYASGCHGCYGGSASGWGSSPPPGYAPPPAEERRQEKKIEKTSVSSQARLLVELPAEAKLYVDDQLMKSTSNKRRFNTPDLVPGQTYYYILRAELLRDGQKHVQTRQVLVHAGEEVRTSFPDLLQIASTQVAASANP